ncbi:MAG: hypothetical protein K8S55_15905 [Phycisphaerae bacterium]|nr:hypothetical protein [Phycisphaerae bacterium]
MQKFQSEQNLIGGIIAGFIAAIVGAVIWATITVTIEFQIGWMAIGVGLLVGLAVRYVGKGFGSIYGIIGASMALLGCLLGNLFSICYFVRVNEQIPFSKLLSLLTPEIIMDLMASTFSPIDLLFYGLAVYEGYRLSIRKTA